MRRSLARVALGLAFLVAGCATGRHTIPDPFGGVARETTGLAAAEVSVVIRNDHWLPIRVWVEWPGSTRFLGDVPAGSSVLYQVPGDLVVRHGPFRLRADPTGSADEARSEPIDLRAGHRVEWRVLKVLANSRVRVM